MFANKQLLAGRSVLLQWAAEALQSSKEVVAPEDHQPWFGMFPNHINNESAKLCSTSLFQYIYILYLFIYSITHHYQPCIQDTGTTALVTGSGEATSIADGFDSAPV